jgi:diacylglycerol kinase family enzyme
MDAKVAVLLNANARRVTRRMVKSLQHVVPEEDLFLSGSPLEARRIAQTVLDRRYQTVFTGGGDGTFMAFVNHILHELELRNQHHYQRPPRFGVLRLGTGNALANLVSASPARGDGILDDVLRARAGEVPGYRRVELFRVDGKRTMFAGMGIDAKIINDYNAVKSALGKGALKGLMTGGGGYITSVGLMTLPYYLTHSALEECEVINGRSVAYRLGSSGETVQEIGPGELIFRGRLNLAAAGTQPYFGYGMKAFPFAGQRRGMMHLRLCSVKATDVLAHLPQIWSGRYFPDSIREFHVAEAEVRFHNPIPLEVAGDAEGYRSFIRLEMCPEQVELVDFTGSVH